MNCRRARRVLACLWALCLPYGAAEVQADERILSFHSAIRIEADGSMLVTETLRVRAEGVNIRRGIYRDFPTRYRDRLGNAYNVDFAVAGLTRDGRAEPWFTERLPNGVRVNFGSDAFLPVPAEYEYALSYRTNRQLGFFPEWDELYWNVTGNGWAFAIDEASATVTLPKAVPGSALTLEGYTGPQGASGRDYTASLADGQGTIRTSTPLRPRAGLTLVFSWPKGIVAEPTRTQRALWLLRDNRGLLSALAALCGTLAWLGNAWWRVGRDPVPGVIFPHYEAPAGFSPAAARYVARMGYDDTAFTAALVDLAVKGQVLITEKKAKYVLQRSAAPQPPADDERALYDQLFRAGQSLELDDANHAIVSGAKRAHAQALHAFGARRYFLNNGLYLLPSLIGSGLLFIAMLASGAVQPLAVAIFVVIAILHGLFAYLLRAPTPEGRKVMDQLEGFKLYLDVAEKDELKLLRAPPLTPQLFERLLPFAIALGVEEAWAARFERALAALTPEQRAAYHPAWYVGSFNPARVHDFTRSVGSSFSTAIAAASTPPGSSSGRGGSFGGGGGFSGGGGGGGGGGGR